MISHEQFLGDMRTFGIRPEERFDETLIDDFIRSKDCGICGKEGPSTVSHCVGKGRGGNNASSSLKMPKCMNCHHDWETLSPEEFVEKHKATMKGLSMNQIVLIWNERIMAYLCTKIREFTGEQKPEPKKVKVRNALKKDSVFKPVKRNTEGLEYCRDCKLPSYRSDEVRHREDCKHALHLNGVERA